jgi:hypothetical protein
MAGWAGELVTEKPAAVAPSQASARHAVEHSRERHTPWIRSRDENPNFSISLEWSGADVSLANVLNPNR